MSSTRARSPVIAISVCFSILWIALASNIVDDARRHDFLNLYTGASLALHGRFAELHDPGVQFRLERELVPATADLVPFVRPPFYALLISPLALAPYREAFWIWIGLQIALFLACCGWALRRFGLDAVAFASMYAPAALAIPHGQDAVLILAVVTASFMLAEKERPAAGAVLALGLIKFHIFVLWPVLLAVQKRWRMLAWFCGCFLAQLAISVLLSGVQGMVRYKALLSRKDLSHLLPSPEKNVNLQGILLNFGVDSGVLYAVLAAATVCTAVLASVRAPVWRLFAMATAGSILIVPHAYGYDAAMLLLPAWCGMSLSARPWTRIAAATVCSPILVLAGLAGPPLIRGAGAGNTGVLSRVCDGTQPVQSAGRAHLYAGIPVTRSPITSAWMWSVPS